MSTRKTYHVTKTDKGWEGKLQGESKPVASGSTKKEVMQKTIGVAKKQPMAQVLIHKMDGKIQEERTYPRSSDPRSSRG